MITINQNVEQEFNATSKLDKDVSSCTAITFNPKTINKLNDICNDVIVNSIKENIGVTLSIHLLSLIQVLNQSNPNHTKINVGIGRFLISMNLFLLSKTDNDEKSVTLLKFITASMSNHISKHIDLLEFSKKLLIMIAIDNDLDDVIGQILKFLNDTVINKYSNITFETCLNAGLCELAE